MFIYRLFINDTTIYIGKAKNIKDRYWRHKSDFANENNQCYKNICLRHIGITIDNFKKYVKYEILYENVPEIILK